MINDGKSVVVARCGLKIEKVHLKNELFSGDFRADDVAGSGNANFCSVNSSMCMALENLQKYFLKQHVNEGDYDAKQ